MTRFRPGGTTTRTQAGPPGNSIPRRLVMACTALAGVGLVVFALSSLAGSSGTSPTALAIRSYVALGDSFTAGPGIPLQLGPGTRPVAPSGCLRSSDNYPSLTARALGLNLRDASCSGATTRDLTASQGPGIPPQLSLLRPSTSLVSLGIGGNDLGFSTIAKNCVAATPWGATRVGWSCESHYTANGVDQLAVAVRRVRSKVATALAAIRARARRARVFVIGYPDLLPHERVRMLARPPVFGPRPRVPAECRDAAQFDSGPSGLCGSRRLCRHGHPECVPQRLLCGGLPLGRPHPGLVGRLPPASEFGGDGWNGQGPGRGHRADHRGRTGRCSGHEVAADPVVPGPFPTALAACRPDSTAASMHPALMPESVQSPARNRLS